MNHTIAAVLAGLTLYGGQAVGADASRAVPAQDASQTRSGLELGSSDILVGEGWGARVRIPCDDETSDCCDPHLSQRITLRWATCCDLEPRDDCGPIPQLNGYLDPPSGQRTRALRPVALVSEGRSFT
jgi:hypothetical protein